MFKTNRLEEGNEFAKFIKMILIVVVIFALFYFITALVSKKETKKSPVSEIPAVIQYEEIIMGNLFQQKEEEYYVLIKQKEDPYLTLFTNLLNQYKQKENALSYYTVDLSVAFNTSYIGTESSFDPDHLKVIGTTLVKIKNQQIIEHYETTETILKQLKSINQ